MKGNDSLAMFVSAFFFFFFTGVGKSKTKQKKTKKQKKKNMAYFLPHLTNGWQVDQAILSEEDRIVIIRFGRDWDPTCMRMDEVLYGVAS